MDTKYNGWTNYETWRINLEILGDINFKKPVTIKQLKSIVEDEVFILDKKKMEDYARAFISEVNFYEIERHINDELKLNEDN